MKSVEYVKKIKNYISIDEIHFAINEFLILTQGTDLHNDVILLSARFNDFMRHVRNDIITFNDAKVAKAKIRFDLLEILTIVEENKNDFEKEINKSEKEYLQIIERYHDNMPIKELDKLSKDLKRLGQSLFDLDFITDRLQVTESRGIIFGAFCAIQVNPNPKYYTLLIDFLNQIANDDNLLELRLRIVYRLVMCVENIINLDNNRLSKEINAQDREKGIVALQNLANHNRCKKDDQLNGKKSIVSRIDKTIKKMQKE